MGVIKDTSEGKIVNRRESVFIYRIESSRPVNIQKRKTHFLTQADVHRQHQTYIEITDTHPMTQRQRASNDTQTTQG